MARSIGFLVFPGFQLLDLTGPLTAFQIAAALAPKPAYRLQVVSLTGGPITSTVGLAIATEPVGGGPFDTFIVAGGEGSRSSLIASEPFLAMMGAVAGGSRRLASVCTGAFVLARCGLLDGRVATTHWRFAPLLQRGYPAIRVEGDRIFSRDGSIWTSAGITAGIDLALALIEDDLGPAASRAVAKELVVYHRRPGGQSQFSELLAFEPESDRIRRALTFARSHLHEPLPVERLADVACLGPRQFARAFRAETGETPAKAVERLRAEAARARIEEAVEPIESTARSVGFTDPERMRRAFLRLFGHPPQALQRMARATRGAGIAAEVRTSA